MASTAVASPRALYRFLLRRVATLPQDAQGYYRHRIRQEYKTHSDESDPVRIQQIIGRAMADAQWVTKKYTIAPHNQD